MHLACTGLAPEVVKFHGERGLIADKEAKKNILRPEALESMYYMWRLTGQQKYREWGWAVFEAFQKHCRGKVGYHSLEVQRLKPPYN